MTDDTSIPKQPDPSAAQPAEADKVVSRWRSELKRPGPNFPCRALSEEEVFALATGIGQIAKRAWTLYEDLMANGEGSAAFIARKQAEAADEALSLLYRVLLRESSSVQGAL